MKTYTLEELRLAQAKGCRIEVKDKDGNWMLVSIPVESLIGFDIYTFRIHPADEWKDRLPRLREGAEWHRNDFTNEMLEGEFRPHLLGETGEGEYLSDGKWKHDGPSTSHLRTTKHCQHTRTRRPVPPEFLHPDELAKQPEAAQATDFGEPWRVVPLADGGIASRDGSPIVDKLGKSHRAIACANACAGIANPAAFVAEAKEMQKALEIAKHALDQIASLQDEKGNRLYESGCADIAHTAFFKLQPFLP